MAAELKLFEALVEAGVSKERARAVVLAQEEAMSHTLSDLATRSDLLATKGELKSEMSLMRAELKAEIGAVRSELKAEIGGVRSELKAEIVSVKSELGSQISLLRADVDGRFALATEQMTAISNRLLFRLGSLMIVLIGLLGGFLTWGHH
ncbi:MAG TPA: hypothetical protein VHZ53_06450 [Steroidobacteraceae bacterium]|jgi:hypothetical protein|nr:hypothetical protein [Steroidobacteraceae bacterium]